MPAPQELAVLINSTIQALTAIRADYSQLGDLTQRVADLQGRITALSTALGNLQTQVTQAEARLAQVQALITSKLDLLRQAQELISNGR